LIEWRQYGRQRHDLRTGLGFPNAAECLPHKVWKNRLENRLVESTTGETLVRQQDDHAAHDRQAVR
jgi:hypothetical protein